MKPITLAFAAALTAFSALPGFGETKLTMAVETPPGDPLNVMLTVFKDDLLASEDFSRRTRKSHGVRKSECRGHAHFV